MHPLWSYTCKIAALQIQSLNYCAITFQDSQAPSDSSGKTTTIFDIYTLWIINWFAASRLILHEKEFLAHTLKAENHTDWERMQQKYLTG